jgi:hypothetical protein
MYNIILELVEKFCVFMHTKCYDGVEWSSRCSQGRCVFKGEDFLLMKILSIVTKNSVGNMGGIESVYIENKLLNAAKPMSMPILFMYISVASALNSLASWGNI